MKGVLTLVSSKKDPVFGTEPLEINFTVRPRLGESFLFTCPEFGFCNTSEVKAVDSETGKFLLTTRNSLYQLEVL